MKIRLGYACICNSVKETFHTINYTNYSKNNNINDIYNVIYKNFDTLKKTIIFNKKNNIHFYRLTSNFIPLSTLLDFDYIKHFKDNYKEICNLISNERIDMHLSEYCVLNSTNPKVVENSIKEIIYHYNLLKAFNIKPNLILHIGSSAFGKEKSITRFINNFKKLDKDIQKSIILENDDKVFNVEDTLKLCQTLNIPFVLDVHHDFCNKSPNDLLFYLENIFKTWNSTPKIHFSSQKTKKEFRSHNDYINSDDFISFLEKIKFLNADIDIMLEAKAKDDAITKLVKELKYKTNYMFLDETSFVVK